MSDNRAPRGLPDRVWLVIRPNGDVHPLYKEPLEGAAEWAKGQYVTVVQYDFATIAYDKRPPLKK